MKPHIFTSVLAFSICLAAHAQTSQGTTTTTTPNAQQRQLPPGIQQREMLPPELQRREMGIIAATNSAAAPAARTNFFGGETNGVLDNDADDALITNKFGLRTNRFGTTNQFGYYGGTNGSANVRVNVRAVTVNDQPIATQIQQTLSQQPVLAQTLPAVNIEVNGGVVMLNGDVQCGAEGVLIQNLIQQQVRHIVRIDNRLRGPGGPFAPAATR
jgi:hypothetical protein